MKIILLTYSTTYGIISILAVDTDVIKGLIEQLNLEQLLEQLNNTGAPVGIENIPY